MKSKSSNSSSTNMSNNNNNNDNFSAAHDEEEEEEKQDDELLSSLLGRLSGSHPHIAVDIVRARNLLEASAGNIELAVALYWDDYMARREHQQQQQHQHRNQPQPHVPPPPQQQQQQQQPHVPPQQQEASVSVSDDEVALLLSSTTTSTTTPSKKASSSRKRKRLSSNKNHTSSSSNNDNKHAAEGSKRASPSSNTTNNKDSFRMHHHHLKKQQDGNDDDDADEETLKKPSAVPRLFAALNGGGSVANKTSSNGYDSNNSSSSSSSSSSDDEDHDSDADYSFLEEEEEDDDDYDEQNNQDKPSNKVNNKDPLSEKTNNEANETKTENNSNNNNNVVILKRPTWLLWGTPEKDDDTDTAFAIPKTWHNAGFTLSTCTAGLSLSPPPNSNHTNSNNINHNNSKKPPECPHHCGSVTALTSIVTAMIYAGVSIQGNTVNCKSTMTSWADLTPTQRRRQYDERLTHVLAAILHIAAKAALKRKQKALQAFEKRNERRKKKRQNKWKQEQQRKNRKNLNSKFEEQSNHDGLKTNQQQQDYYYDDHLLSAATDDLEVKRRQNLHRKLNLCPVCTWEEDSQREPCFPGYRNNNDEDENNSNADHSDIQIRISYTNINDLKLFVQSNLRSFVGPGGCALLMENILLIHGVKRVTKMVANARKKTHAKTCSDTKSHHDTEKIQPLLECTCEKRQINKWEKFMESKRNSSDSLTSQNFDSIKPPGHECLSIELLSILLTGNAHTFIEDMSVSSLGIGFLDTNHQYNFARRTKNTIQYPIKPIWIIRGESCYSTIWHNDFGGAKVFEERAKSLGNRSKTGSDSFRLEHWNSWYNLPQSKTSMRIITARKKIHSDKDFDEDDCFISQEEINNVSINLDDKNYFPKHYCRWRFRFLKTPSSDSSANNHDVWIPYFRLDKHQKQIVELKLAPKINLAIWSRWQDAKVDDFQPESNFYPLV